MNSERKMLYISVGINFVVGVILGAVLFYGQLRSNPGVFETEYIYSKDVMIADFFRVAWLNILWLFSIFIAHNMISVAAMHPIVAIRGCAGSFSMLYILHFLGIKEAAASVLPQCLSILPLIAVFSVETVMKRRELVQSGFEPFSMRRSDVAGIFVFSLLAAGAEVLFFRFFCVCLF